MLPTSHRAPIIPALGTPQGALAEAFDAFMATAGRMEASYGQLQNEVAQLRKELEERNAALASSLAENRSIRTALHRILQALPCGVIVIDAKGSIVLINPEAHRLVGKTASAKLALKDFPKNIQAALNSAMLREDEHEFSLEGEKGSQWLSIRKSTLRVPATNDSDGRAATQQSILILRDVTARKEVEQQREASRNMVALGEMSSILAHEIRNPLSSMELWAGLLAKQPVLEDESKYLIDNLQAGVRALSATVNNVLQLHSKASPSHVRLRLMTVLQNGISFIRPLADQAGIKLALRADLENLEISGDPNGLQQIILNLAVNAFRHTSMGGTLTISARRNESTKTVTIEVADSGEGISEEVLKRIFEPGFSGKGQTAGLGLTICQRIVEQHQGTINVTSQPGKGTTFTMEFPVL